MKTEPQTFTIQLEAVQAPDKFRTPPIMRLRKFLKAALRFYGLRATEVRELENPELDPACKCDMCAEDRRVRGAVYGPNSASGEGQ